MSTANFSDEFKSDAVHQFVEPGHPVAEVSKRLGVTCSAEHSADRAGKSRMLQADTLLTHQLDSSTCVAWKVGLVSKLGGRLYEICEARFWGHLQTLATVSLLRSAEKVRVKGISYSHLLLDWWHIAAEP